MFHFVFAHIRSFLLILFLGLLTVFAVIPAIVNSNAGGSVEPPEQAESTGQQESQSRADKIIPSAKRIPNKYIVVLEDWAAGPRGEQSKAGILAAELGRAHNGNVRRVFKHALNGFAIDLDENQARELANDPRVKYVEEDREVHLSTTQPNATWGLDRVDQHSLPVDTLYNYNQTGAGVRAYIIDSGIRYSHSDFGGRASFGFDALGGNGSDCYGHGTHVAGTLGGTTYGVAKNVLLV